jgi:hypothetical protein
MPRNSAPPEGLAAPLSVPALVSTIRLSTVDTLAVVRCTASTVITANIKSATERWRKLDLEIIITGCFLRVIKALIIEHKDVNQTFIYPILKIINCPNGKPAL